MNHPGLASMTFLCLAAASAAGAHEPVPEQDRVQLSASAGREVDTDTLLAVMYKEHQSQDQAAAANEVNQAVSWGVELAKAAGMDTETTVYRSYPVYRNQRLAGWRVLQSFRIETADGTRLAALLAELQSRLSIQSLSHVLSPEARAAAEEGLMEEALNTFQRRAGLIARTLARDGHRIISINVSSIGAGPVHPMRAARAAVMESDAQVTAPSIEGGRERVEVTVSGTVELNPAR